MFAESDISR